MKTLSQLNNKKGFSLMELLAYITIVGMVITLLTATLTFVIKTYTNVNIKGEVYTEANYIMSSVLTGVNSFDADYAVGCGQNCIKLVKQDQLVIDAESGIVKEQKVNEELKLEIIDNNLYINNLKLNSDDFKLKINPDDANPNTINNRQDDEFSYIFINSCFDQNKDLNESELCQKAVIEIKLSIYRSKNTSNEVPYRFLNRITF